MDKIQIEDLTFVKYIEQKYIDERVAALATLISQEEHDKDPIFVVVLNGAFMFASDLMKQITLDCEVRFIKVSSYEGLESTGKVSFDKSSLGDVNDRNIILIEDIVDSGTTMHRLLPELHKLGATSVKIATLLHKPDAAKYEVSLDYVGFSIPDLFVVGYGLDYNDHGRNFTDIYQIVK